MIENKVLQDYVDSGRYEDGVSCVMFTYNNEEDVVDCLNSIKNEGCSELLVVDGSSTDSTVSLAKEIADKVIVTEKGFKYQYEAVMKQVKYKYFMGLEADHRYGENFPVKMKNYIEKSPFLGVQAMLRCSLDRNFFEKGLKIFYEVHHKSAGEQEMIAGPSMYYTEFIEDYLLELTSIGAAIDTARGEFLKRNGYKVGLAPVVATQYEEMRWPEFFHKYYWYGLGDCEFYRAHENSWTLNRKIKSLLHVFNRYFIDYPVKSILMKKNPFVAIPFFWLSAVVRYSGWVTCVLASFFSRKSR